MSDDIMKRSSEAVGLYDFSSLWFKLHSHREVECIENVVYSLDCRQEHQLKMFQNAVHELIHIGRVAFGRQTTLLIIYDPRVMVVFYFL